MQLVPIEPGDSSLLPTCYLDEEDDSGEKLLLQVPNNNNIYYDEQTFPPNQSEREGRGLAA